MKGWIGVAVAAAAAGAVYARRTRGYGRVDRQLRSPFLWLRSPSVGPRLLKLARRAPATRCVEGVGLTCERVPSTDGSNIMAYVYRPDGAAENGPVMLFTHGGGLVMGSAAGYHEAVSAHARDLGMVVVSTEYRLAPEHPFPTPLDDVLGGYRWLVEHADLLGVDVERIVVAGDSAGGGLTAALCQRLLDEGDRLPVLQVLIYPMLDDRTTVRSIDEQRGQLVWTRGSNLFGWTSYLGRAPSEADAPEYAAAARRDDLSGLPDAWIGVGTLDLFLDEDLDYARRLRAAGVGCDVDVVEGAFHGFDAIGDAPVGRQFRSRMLSAVRRAVRDGHVARP